MTSTPPPLASRGKRLARRYPVLDSVPEDERPAIVRTALRHPLVLALVLGGGLLLLPLYFEWIFTLLGIEAEQDLLMKIAKLGGAVLLPCVLAVPLLSRFVLPVFIRKEMKKRGYAPGNEE